MKELVIEKVGCPAGGCTWLIAVLPTPMSYADWDKAWKTAHTNHKHQPTNKQIVGETVDKNEQ